MKAATFTLALVGCAQTDLVASHHDRGRPDAGSCLAEACDVGARETFCAGNGIAARVGDGCSSEALPVARYALCSCSDLVSSSNLVLDAFDGTPATPSPGRAALGVNGNLSVSEGARIDGPVELLGSADSTALEITQVDDAPCGCSATLDVEAAIAARADDNDDARAAFAPAELDGFAGARTLTLDCGRYYFTRIAGSDKLTLRTRGNVALYVAGNIELDDAFEIESTDGQVSLFVGGELRVRGAFSLGGAPGSGQAGLFAGGQGTLAFGGSSSIIGGLYAPRAELVNGGTLEVYGPLLARRVAPTGDLVVHYDVRRAEPLQCR